jgi:hypothetical protein
VGLATARNGASLGIGRDGVEASEARPKRTRESVIAQRGVYNSPMLTGGRVHREKRKRMF